MDAKPESLLRAGVTKYTLGRLRLAQVLIPLAPIASVLARRQFGTVTVSAAVVLLLLIAILLFSSIKRIGRQPVTFDRGALCIGSSESVAQTAVRRWTINGAVATVYSTGVTYRLRAETGNELGIQAGLRQVFGAPTALRRRGTPRARLAALCAAIVGLGLVVSGFTFYDSLVPIILGIPSFIFGIATFGALSQRVIT